MEHPPFPHRTPGTDRAHIPAQRVDELRASQAECGRHEPLMSSSLAPESVAAPLLPIPWPVPARAY